MTDWLVYTGTGVPRGAIERLPAPPNWRRFERDDEDPPSGEAPEHQRQGSRQLGGHTAPLAGKYNVDHLEIVNAALYLRRPLLVTGKPGIGKSTLAQRVARELELGPMLRWSVTSRTVLRDGLYRYDALARLHDLNVAKAQGRNLPEDVGRYIRLGPLGTALLPRDRPRVLLVDEIDKSDIDLPNDLLHAFEEGEFEIEELIRSRADQSADDPSETVHVRVHASDERAPIIGGRVRCREFPFVVMTSNGEREFPKAFLRRCLRLNLTDPPDEQLAHIIDAHFGAGEGAKNQDLIKLFLARKGGGDLAVDQLLNAVFITSEAARHKYGDRERLATAMLKHLNGDPR